MLLCSAMAWGLSEIHLGRVRLRAEDVAEAVADASSVLYLLCSCSDQRGRKKEEYLVYMDMVVPDGSLSTVSRRRQPGERNCTRNFVLCFCLIFFRASKWGDRASSRGLVLRLGLRHRRSDPIVITDRSSSLCVHGPPGSIRWAELVCGRFSAAPTNSRRGGDTAPSYDSSVRRRTPSVHRNRRGTRTVVEGRASIVTSPGGTAAPGSWIHHVGVLNADRVLAPPATACAAGGDWVCWALLSGPFASSAISSIG